jgi:hydroxyacylglutathione hydrolase
MPKLEIRQFPCRSDNFGVLIHDEAAGVTAAIDAPEEAAVREALQKAGWKLTHIFTTHHHFDHVAGHQALKAETGCTIYGPEKEADKIPGIDVKVKEGDRLKFGSFELNVLETPGHTLGHITFYIPNAGQGDGNSGVAFVGDTLFSVGCGRVLEGTFPQMWHSLEKLMKLPPETLIYCGHEYTQSNIKFAQSVEPGNKALASRKQEADAERAAGKATLPVSLGQELQVNPFLRVKSEEIRKNVGLGADASDAMVFEELRRRKDNF